MTVRLVEDLPQGTMYVNCDQAIVKTGNNSWKDAQSNTTWGSKDVAMSILLAKRYEEYWTII